MKTLKELNEALDANIPRSAVKSREGAGRRSFSYLSTDYVIDRMNKIAGNLNWSTETIENKAVFEGTLVDSYGKEKQHVSYIARVKIEVQHIDESGRVVRTSHTGTGYGDGTDAVNRGKAHELAAKEAESDALKRACKNLGQSMGLALYDKDQTNVEDDAPAGKPVQAAAPTSSAATSSPKPAQAANNAVAAPVTVASATKPSEPARQSNPAPTRPAFNREAANKRINTLSKIVLSQGKATVEDLKADMKKDYGTDVKEELSDEHAQAFMARLEKSASA